MRKLLCVLPLVTFPLVILFVAAHPLLETTVGDETPAVPKPVQVSVMLVDGTELTAVVDAETNDQLMVLQFSSPGILLRRNVPWNRVAGATLNGRRLSAAELRAELDQLNLNVGIDPLAAAVTSVVESTGGGAQQVGGVVALTSSRRVAGNSRSASEPDQIQSLDVSAEVANWDRDAAIDGIRLYVRPLNASGDIVPVSGYANVKLFGQAFMQVGGIRDNRKFDAFPALSEWTQRVRKQDFDSDGAVYQLAFRRTNPEFNRKLGSFGLTHARLSVPGEGVFQASDAMTQVRPFSVYRDWHQQLTGNRFLPAEHVGTGN